MWVNTVPRSWWMNGDELLDLIIGEENGNLNYYENTGTATDPVFTLLDELWGSVDVRKPLTLTGYSTLANL